MKSGIGWCLAMCLGVAAAKAGWAAEGSVGVDINSAYVWRGLTLNDGLVAQPWLSVSLPGGFAAGFWANMVWEDRADRRQEREFSEVDLRMSYARDIGAVRVDASYQEYFYPHQVGGDTRGADGTRELGVAAELEALPGWNLRLELYRDMDEVRDFYASAGMAYGVAIGDSLGVHLVGTVGYAGEDWATIRSGGEKGGFHDYSAGLQVEYRLTDAVGLGAHLSHTGSLDDKVLPEQDTRWHGGVAVSLTL